MYRHRNKALSLIILLVSTLIPVLALGGSVKLTQIPLVVFTVIVYSYILKFLSLVYEALVNSINEIHSDLEGCKHE